MDPRHGEEDVTGPAPPADRRLRTASGASLLGATVVVISSFMPWIRSGTADRTSYQMVAAAERLEVLDPGTQRVATAWYLVVVAVGVAWLATAGQRHRIVAALCLVVGSLSTLLGTAAVVAPLPALPGAQLAAVAGGATILASIATLGISFRTGRDTGRSGHGARRGSGFGAG